MLDDLLKLITQLDAGKETSLESILRDDRYKTGGLAVYFDRYGAKLCARQLLPLQKKIKGFRNMEIRPLLVAMRDRLQREILTGGDDDDEEEELLDQA